jgi:hypothetical protein
VELERAREETRRAVSRATAAKGARVRIRVRVRVRDAQSRLEGYGRQRCCRRR